MADVKSSTSFTSTDSRGLSPHGIVQDDIETWRAHLTPKLRTLFKTKGHSIVEDEVLRGIYRKPGDDRKHFAAQAWLHGKRADKRRRRNVFLLIACAGLVVGVLAYLRS